MGGFLQTTGEYQYNEYMAEAWPFLRVKVGWLSNAINKKFHHEVVTTKSFRVGFDVHNVASMGIPELSTSPFACTAAAGKQLECPWLEATKTLEDAQFLKGVTRLHSKNKKWKCPISQGVSSEIVTREDQYSGIGHQVNFWPPGPVTKHGGDQKFVTPGLMAQNMLLPVLGQDRMGNAIDFAFYLLIRRYLSHSLMTE